MLRDLPMTVKPNGAWYDVGDVMVLAQWGNLLPLLYMTQYLSAQSILEI